MAPLRALFFLALVLAPAGRALAGDIAHVPEIEVVGGNWGSAAQEDIRSVLRTTAAALLVADVTISAPIQVRPAADGPRVLFERGPQGEYVVELSARDRHWARFAYQFAHELCHIASHFDEKEMREGQVIAPNQWFEETLCEAAAIATLRQLSASWETDPPHPHWRAYAPAFAEYAQTLLNEEHRWLHDDMSPAAWYESRQASLRADPYHRADNEVMANVLLPLFEGNPGSWGTLGYLNRDRSATLGSLADYLGSWRSAAPGRHRPVIDAITALVTPR